MDEHKDDNILPCIFFGGWRGANSCSLKDTYTKTRIFLHDPIRTAFSWKQKYIHYISIYHTSEDWLARRWLAKYFSPPLRWIIVTYLERNPHQLVFMLVLYRDWIGIWRCWFLQREETQRNHKKIVRARRKPTTHSTRIWHRARIKPRPHW